MKYFGERSVFLCVSISLFSNEKAQLQRIHLLIYIKGSWLFSVVGVINYNYRKTPNSSRDLNKG